MASVWRHWSLRLKLLDVAMFVIAGSALGYFIWQAEHGPRSIAYQATIIEQQKAKAAELDRWREKRLTLAKRVALMRPRTIDEDMLDELARAQLSVAATNEIIVPLPKF